VTSVTEGWSHSSDNNGEVRMPVLVVAVIFFALFLVMGVLATVAVLSETRGMSGSVLKLKRLRNPLPK
jgi:hypothetical protein